MRRRKRDNIIVIERIVLNEKKEDREKIDKEKRNERESVEEKKVDRIEILRKSMRKEEVIERIGNGCVKEKVEDKREGIIVNIVIDRMEEERKLND